MQRWKNAIGGYPLLFVSSLFALSKLCHFLFFCSIYKFESHYDCVFDKSNELLYLEIKKTNGYQLLSESFLNKYFVYLSSWDTHHYIKNIVLTITNDNKNKLYSENSMVFSPFVWCKLLSCWLLYIPSEYWLHLVFIINNAISYVQVIVFYQLLSLCGQNTFRAVLTTSMFIFNISGIFQTTFYAENLSVLGIFVGLYLRLLMLKRQKSFLFYVISLPVFALSVLNRPNCLIVGLLYVYDVIYFFASYQPLRATAVIMQGIMLGLVAFFFLFSLPDKMFCERSEFSWCVNSRDHCFKLLSITINVRLPMFYSYLQSKYWNVGLFKYYTINNLPNFLLAFPQTAVITASIMYKFNNTINRQFIDSLKLVAIALLFTVYTVAHVQIINRISNIVAPLWISYILEVLLQDVKSSKMARFIVLSYLTFNTIYWIVQAYLFLCFLPPA